MAREDVEHAAYVLATPAEGEYRESGSRFYAYAQAVHHRDDVEAAVKAAQALHPKARHFVYAYRLGTDEFATDAGEPAGSSGPPVLRVLKSRGLVQVVAVVVRYFGGTKLGIPGLIRAYSAATEDALMQATCLPYVPTVELKFQFEYADTTAVQACLAQYQAKSFETRFEAVCTFQVSVPEEQAKALSDCLRSFITPCES